MLIKTVLNRLQKFKNFVYEKVEFDQSDSLVITVQARKGSKPKCSVCKAKGPTYDHQPERRYEFIPLWGIKTYLAYKPRRVSCKNCGTKVEQVPWSEGKNQNTKIFELFLAHWAKKLSWMEVAREFKVSWQAVYRAIEYVVDYGLANRSLEDIKAIGIDEIHWSKVQGFLTVVYQIDQGCKRLLFVSQGRSVKSILRFFRLLGKERCAKLEFVCSDMWKAYIKVIAKKAVNALHILDRFHIVSNLNKALDEVRAQEAKSLKAKGIEVLKNSRYCFLKKPSNLTEKQSISLKELLELNLRSVKAYLLKEEFNLFWKYSSSAWAEKFLDQWCKKVMYSKLEPMKKIAKSLRKHKPLILNWFKAKKLYSSGIVEGLNNKTKVTVRKSYGFSTYKAMEIALFHQLGSLPEPQITHRFW